MIFRIRDPSVFVLRKARLRLGEAGRGNRYVPYSAEKSQPSPRQTGREVIPGEKGLHVVSSGGMARYNVIPLTWPHETVPGSEIDSGSELLLSEATRQRRSERKCGCDTFIRFGN